MLGKEVETRQKETRRSPSRARRVWWGHRVIEALDLEPGFAPDRALGAGESRPPYGLRTSPRRSFLQGRHTRRKRGTLPPSQRHESTGCLTHPGTSIPCKPSGRRGHEDAVDAAAFSPDGRRLVTGTFGDRIVRLWDLKNLVSCPRVLRGTQRESEAAAISQDTRWLVAGGKDGTARLWDLTAQDPAVLVQISKKVDARIWFSWENGRRSPAKRG